MTCRKMVTSSIPLYGQGVCTSNYTHSMPKENYNYFFNPPILASFCLVTSFSQSQFKYQFNKAKNFCLGYEPVGEGFGAPTNFITFIYSTENMSPSVGIKLGVPMIKFVFQVSTYTIWLTSYSIRWYMSLLQQLPLS